MVDKLQIDRIEQVVRNTLTDLCNEGLFKPKTVQNADGSFMITAYLLDGSVSFTVSIGNE